MTAGTAATLGLRARTGWATAIALCGKATDPTVAGRWRVELVPSALPRQMFHVAAGRAPEEGQALVAEVCSAAERTAADVLGGLRDELAGDGHQLQRVGIAVRPPRPILPLTRILASHAAMHGGGGRGLS